MNNNAQIFGACGINQPMGFPIPQVTSTSSNLEYSSNPFLTVMEANNQLKVKQVSERETAASSVDTVSTISRTSSNSFHFNDQARVMNSFGISSTNVNTTMVNISSEETTIPTYTFSGLGLMTGRITLSSNNPAGSQYLFTSNFARDVLRRIATTSTTITSSNGLFTYPPLSSSASATSTPSTTRNPFSVISQAPGGFVANGFIPGMSSSSNSSTSLADSGRILQQIGEFRYLCWLSIKLRKFSN